MIFDDGGGGSSNDAIADCNHNESNVKVNNGDNDYVDYGNEDLEACGTLIPWLSVSRKMNAMNLSFQTAFLITPIKSCSHMTTIWSKVIQAWSMACSMLCF